MKIGLINVDNTKFPNIALGKIAMWHKMKRDDVEWYNALNHYDKVYLSKIFTFTPDVCYYVNADETIKGGTGYDIHSSLPEEIDMMQPDYSIYPTIDSRTIRIRLYRNGKRIWLGGQTARKCFNLLISRITSLARAFIAENTFNDRIMEIKNVSINNYPILDACCGGRMFYFDKHDSRVLFQDIRDVETTLCDGRHFEVKPDIQADFTNMPYPDGSFSMVVFDPPHLVHSRGKKSKMVDMYGTLSDKTVPTGYQKIKYGALYSDWRDMLTKGFTECFRVLKQGGFLIFKWNETDIKVSEVLKLTPEKPVFGHISGKRSNTHWICFMKKEK